MPKPKRWDFYHFLSEADLIDARQTGITNGVLALAVIPDAHNLKRNTFKHMRGIQWLTTNKRFIPMDAPYGPPRSSMYPGRKAAYRVTVSIPPEFRRNTPDWPTFAHHMIEGGYFEGNHLYKLDPKMYQEINLDLGNPGEWFLFCGPIPPEWISTPVRNPSLPRDVATVLSKILIPETPGPDVLGHEGQVDVDGMPCGNGTAAPGNVVPVVLEGGIEKTEVIIQFPADVRVLDGKLGELRPNVSKDAAMD